MAAISGAKLTIKRDTSRNTADVKVTCKVHFTGLELCLMKLCAKSPWFKLKCQLWGADSGLTGSDDFLYAFAPYYFPDGTPSATESRSFDVTVGESLLDEDLGKDEVYGRLILTNLFNRIDTRKNTNQVTGHF